ncbi:MAG: two-component system sensor histidine kinase NtrB [Treponema sp.]
MNNFINKAVKKSSKMNEVQLRSLVQNIFDEYSLLDSMIDSLNDGVVILDANNKVIKVNKALFLIFNPSLKKSENINIEELIDDNDINNFISFTILNQEKCSGKEFFIQKKDGNQYISLSILPLVRHKKIHGTIIIISNITEKKLNEIKTQRLESLARLTTAAASISHEIKNPLAAISIHVQLAKKMVCSCDIFNEKMKKHFSVIEEEIDRLNTIVVDFLFAVRPIKFDFRLVNINAVIASLVSTFQDEFKAYNIKIEVELNEALPLLQGDERFLRQALINIIVNSKYAMMEHGGILNITTTQEENSLIVLISDSGCGIPHDILDKIFEPYFTTKDSGTGLGLTMTYKVIKEHGGDIHVYSDLGKGATFKISLPIMNDKSVLLITDDRN